MANLAGYNAANHEPMSEFTLMPDGEYRAIATESEFKATKQGNGEYLQITWEFIDEPYRKRKTWSRLNLMNPNATAVEIAQRELSSICRAVGILTPKDSSELHGRPIILKIGHETRKDNGEVSNRIKGYASVDAGGSNATPPAGPPATSVPNPPPAAPAAGSVPPWRR
jgi:hypothetical protein